MRRAAARLPHVPRPGSRSGLQRHHIPAPLRRIPTPTVRLRYTSPPVGAPRERKHCVRRYRRQVAAHAFEGNERGFALSNSLSIHVIPTGSDRTRLSREAKLDRHPPRPPRAAALFENAGASRAAASATAFVVKRPGGDYIPVATDDAGAAGMAVSTLPRLVVSIARINVAQAGALRDLSRTRERGGRRRRRVTHLPVRMKRREMQRHIGAEPAHDPFGERSDLRWIVIAAGDQQRRDLQPDAGLALDVFEGV